MQLPEIPPELKDRITQATFTTLPTLPPSPVLQALQKAYHHPDMPYKILLSIVIESIRDLITTPLTSDMSTDEIQGYYECYYDVMQILYDLQLIKDNTDNLFNPEEVHQNV